MAALINLTVNSSTAQAQADLDSYVSKSEEVRAEVEKFKESFDGAELDAFLDKTNRVAAAVTATDGPLKGMKTQQKALRKEIQSLIASGLDPESEQLTELVSQYNNVTAQVEHLETQEKKLKAESAKAAKAAKTQAASTKDLATQQKAANASFTSGIKKLVTMAAAYMSVYQAVGFLKDSVSVASEYLEAIANINTLIEITDGDFQSLDASLTKVSEQFAMQKSELASGVYQAVSAGASSLAEAEDIVAASATLSTGALIENSDAVDIVTTAMNAYRSSNVTASDAVDAFFTTVDQGKVTGEELANSIGNSISLFAQAKIPLDELGGGLSALTKVGVNASESTTQLNAIVTAFLKPSAAMTEALEAQGYATGSALLGAEGLTGAIEFLSDATGGSIDKMATLVPRIRGFRGAVSLSADDMALLNEAMEIFLDNEGAGTTAAEKMTDGFAAQAFDIEQAKIQIENFKIELGQKLLPIISSVIKNADILGYSFLGIAAGLTTFLIVTKGATLINALTTAFKLLNVAIAANPIGAVAVAITAVLVPALVYMYKNWDTVSISIQTTLAILGEKFDLVAIGFKASWTVATSVVKLAFVELSTYLTGGFLTAVLKTVEVASKIPFIGDKFDGVFETIKNAKDSVVTYRESTEDAVTAAVDGAAASVAATKAQTDANIEALKAEAEARKAAVEAAAAEVPDTGAGGYSPVDPDPDPDDNTAIEKSLSERLSILNNAHAEEIDTFDSFYSDRIDQDQVALNDQVQFIQDTLASVLEIESLSDSERLAATESAEAAITAVQQAQADARYEIMKSSLNAYSSIMGSMEDILNDFDDSSKASVIVQKGLASAQALINSYLAFTEVLKDPSYVGQPWLRTVNAASVLASGIAAQVSIATTDVSTAQTGTGLTGITVPDTGSAGADNVAVMASPGEKVSVTPRNSSSSNSQNISIIMHDSVVIEIVKDAIDNGDLIISMDNIQGA